MTPKKQEESKETTRSHPQPVKKKIQTAEGWKRSMMQQKRQKKEDAKT
jgi:hypothetical protein